jgi:hypothetical protein
MSPQANLFLLIVFFPFFFSNCKLDLNNAGDWKSRSFFETVLLNDFLKPLRSSPLCNTSSRWERSFGAGTNKIVVDGFITLPNEDVIIAGFTNEDLGSGRNYNFSGTVGTTINGFVMRINGVDGSTIWTDYLGTIDGDVGVKVLRFFNGDILFSYLALSEQSGAISSTANLGISVPSFALARYDFLGTRKWHTYFDSTDLATTNATTIDSNDQIHLLARLNGTNGHLPFSEFPTPSNTALGTASDTDILYGLVSSAGIPKSQIYISSTAGDVPVHIIPFSNFIFISGYTSGNLNGFTGHPSLGNERVFVLRATDSQSINWINYRGASSATTTGTPVDFQTDGKDFYILGRTGDNFGTPISAYQGSSPTKNYYFEKIDFSGNTQWLTFLGSNTTTITEGIRIPLFLQETNSLIYSTLLGPSNGTRYTGLGSAETGSGSDILQRVTTKISSKSGIYEKVVFETNDIAPKKSHYTILKEICAGKLFRGERVFPDLNDNTKINFKLKVFPTSELP